MILMIVHLNQQLLVVFHEVIQKDVQVYDNVLMHKILDHFVYYLNVLIEKPKRNDDAIFFTNK